MRLSTPKVEFSDYSFIRLFLSFLIKNNTIKFDIATLGYDLIEFYDNENFKDLFDMPIKHQIEGNFVDLSNCLQEAMLGGIISAISIQNTNDRLILLNKEEADDIINSYENKYINKMKQLVDDYIEKTKFKNLKEACSKYPQIQLTLDGKSFVSEFNAEHIASNYAENGFVEKFCLSEEERDEVKRLRKKL